MRNNNFGNSINNRIKVTPNRERSQSNKIIKKIVKDKCIQ